MNVILGLLYLFGKLMPSTLHDNKIGVRIIRTFVFVKYLGVFYFVVPLFYIGNKCFNYLVQNQVNV